ncbi:MAG: sulfate ABC transporter permease subunit CysT [Capsulimonadaceae bacterium]|nr:sulfate ABC transporter permease subunit CysT [Capsulimonadaceae bacterium]
MTAVASPKTARTKTRSLRVIPGFGLSLGYTVFYLSIIVLIPLSTIFLKSAQIGLSGMWRIMSDPRVLAAFNLSFGSAFAAALTNVFAGVLIAWVLVRYRFPGVRLIDALIDLPFALPTSVAGISLAAVYANTGYLGRYLESGVIGLPALAGHHFALHFPPVKIAYTGHGVYIALLFIGLPFIVRTVQPVLEELGADVEEAAASLGASRWQTIVRVIFPMMLPALLTGFSLAFARGLGEYGSVIFISNNKPFEGEILPKLIIEKLEQFNYPGATTIGVLMLLASFALLLTVNVLQRWASRWQ